MVLRDSATGELVDGGKNIPLDQVLAGPRRAQVHFEPDSDVRSLGEMLAGDPNAAMPAMRSGHKAGKRAGWGPLAPGAMVAYQTVLGGPQARQLTVGKVLVNHREGQILSVQPYGAKWSGVCLQHTPLFQTFEGLSLIPI